jgi:hypothetical protein
MAITFVKKDKKQKYFIFIFVLLVLAFIFILLLNLLKKPGEEAETEIWQPKRVNIDFNFLESPALENLQFIEEIPLFEEEVGRENPFLPY